MPKEIRINERRFAVLDWTERFGADERIHACGKPIVGTFKATLPRSVGIGAVIELNDGKRRAIVDDEEPGGAGAVLIRGSLLGVEAGVPLGEQASTPRAVS